MEVVNTLGRRKTSVARVYLMKGTGKVTVNKRDYKEFFPVAVLQSKIEQPFSLTETTGQYDVKVNVAGTFQRRIKVYPIMPHLKPAFETP